MQATDSDAGDTIYFALVPNADSSRFSINSTINTVTITTTSDIDFESVTQDYDITIRAFDRDPSGSSFNEALCVDLAVTIIVLDANDHAPAFSRPVYRASFSEDVNIGFNTNQMRVVAGDSDSGINGRVRVTI